MVSIEVNPQISADAFIDILQRSGLAERRPVEDSRRIAKMLEEADLILVAKDANDKIAGVARCLTDFAYVCYVSDLAICKTRQGEGIGRMLLQRVRSIIQPEARVFLISAPAAVGFYEKINLPRIEQCFDVPAGIFNQEGKL